MNKNIIKTVFAAVSMLAVIILTSCGAAELAAPGLLTISPPDPENPNRIDIGWNAVDGADIYYIYRSSSKDGTYTNEGFSVTSNEFEKSNGSTEVRYSYIDVLEEENSGTWWYKVTAASNGDITFESAMSPAASGSTYIGTWSTALSIFTSAAQLKMDVSGGSLYVISSGGTASEAINGKKYSEDENSTADTPPMVWTSLTGSPGNTNGSADNPYSIFISGGELYTVFADTNASAPDSVSMQYYHDSGTAELPTFAWEAVGTEGFNGTAATQLSTATVGFPGDIYSAFLESSDVPQLYKYNATTETWFEINLDPAGEFPTAVSTLKLINNNNTLYVGYEDTAAPGLYLRAYDYDDGIAALQAGGQVTVSAVEDGNAVFVSGGGSLYAVFITDTTGAFNAMQLDIDVWTALTNSTGIPVTDAGAGYGTIDALWFNNSLYVFYVNSGDSDKGWVKYYSEIDGWQSAEKNGTAITGSDSVGSGLAGFQLASSGNILYAGYIENSTAYVRILE